VVSAASIRTFRLGSGCSEPVIYSNRGLRETAAWGRRTVARIAKGSASWPWVQQSTRGAGTLDRAVGGRQKASWFPEWEGKPAGFCSSTTIT